MPHQRILLVDDHEVVRLGLKSLLERHPSHPLVSAKLRDLEAMERAAGVSHTDAGGGGAPQQVIPGTQIVCGACGCPIANSFR